MKLALSTFRPKLLTSRRLESSKKLYDAGNAHVWLEKTAGPAKATYSLAGRLYLSRSGWLMLDIPAAFVRGAFDALHEPGAELPLRDGRLESHVSVMRPEEIGQIGGPEKLSERGHTVRFNLGHLKACEPDGWPEMSKVWFVEVVSPELKKIRASYGLTPEPKYPFHATIAVRRRGVLQNNDVAKGKEASCGDLAGAGGRLCGGLPVPGGPLEPGHPDSGLGRAQEVKAAAEMTDEEFEYTQAMKAAAEASPIVSFGSILTTSSNPTETSNGTASPEMPTLRPGEAADRVQSRQREKAGQVNPLQGMPAAVSRLVHHAPSLLQQETPQVPNLRRPEHPGLRKLASGLPQLLAGHGSSAGPWLHPGEAEHRRRLHARELLLGHAETAAEKQADQRAADVPRGDHVHGGVGREVEHERRDPLATGVSRLVGRESFDHSGHTKQAGSAVRHIAVAGHSGIGKSTLAKKLSKKLGLPIYKIDHDHRWRRGESIKDHPEAFTPGTKAYRKYHRLRYKLVQKALARDKPSILEGTQLLVEPSLLRGHRVIVLDGDEETVVRQRLNRDQEEGKLSPDGANKGVREAKARYLFKVLEPEVEKLKDQPGVEVVQAGHTEKWLNGQNSKSTDYTRERSPTVAVDLDGTLFEADAKHEPGKFGKPRPDYHEVIRKLHQAGCVIIIHTVRDEDEAIEELLEEHQVPFDYINESPNQPSDSSDKLFADVYLDDRGVSALDSARVALKKIKTILEAENPPPAFDLSNLKGAAAVEEPGGGVLSLLPFLDDLIAMHLARKKTTEPDPANPLRPATSLPPRPPLFEKLTTGLAKESASHNARAPITYRGERRVTVCPHCDRDLEEADIYTDKKGWKFCRRCLRKGKGSLLLPQEKQAVGANARLAARLSGTTGPAREFSRELAANTPIGQASREAVDQLRAVAAGSGKPRGLQTLFVKGRQLKPSSLLRADVEAADRLALTGRHGLERRPLSLEEMMIGLPGGMGEAVSYHSYGGGPRDTPFQAARRVAGTPLFVSGHPEVAVDYRKGYLGQLDTPSLREVGPSSPVFHQRFQRDTRSDNPVVLRLRKLMASLTGAGVQPLPGSEVSGRLPQYEAAMTAPESLQPYLLASYKQLPSGLGYQKVFSKQSVAAAGIPDRSHYGDLSKLQPGQLLDWLVSRHEAERAGLHRDLRIGSPEMGLHSWAVRKGLPGLGKKHLAVHQPLHAHDQLGFEGEIPHGYGKGKVTREQTGKVLITRVGPDEIHFTEGCVSGDTVLLTPKGLVPIREAMQQRDEVRVMGVLGRRVGFFPIERFHHKIADRVWCEVSFDTPEGEQRLRCTAEHHVYVAGYGFIPAAALRRGHQLLLQPAMEAVLHDPVTRDADVDQNTGVVAAADPEGHKMMQLDGFGSAAPANGVTRPNDSFGCLTVEVTTEEVDTSSPAVMRDAVAGSHGNTVSHHGHVGGVLAGVGQFGDLTGTEPFGDVQVAEPFPVVELGVGATTTSFPLDVRPSDLFELGEVSLHDVGDALEADIETSSDLGQGLPLQDCPSDNVWLDFHGGIIATSWVTVKSVRHSRRSTELFDLTVHDAGCYFANGVLTHNSSRYPQRYVLKKMRDRNWLLINATKTEAIPHEKVHYAKVPAEKAEGVLAKLQPGSSVQAKVDGAASLTKLMKDHYEVVSYRAAKGTGHPIVHTERFLHARPKVEIPKTLQGTVLRGELYGVDRGGKAIPPQQLGGLLNAGVARSLQEQEARGVRLRQLLFDVDQLPGPPRQPARGAEPRNLLSDVEAHPELPRGAGGGIPGGAEGGPPEDAGVPRLHESTPYSERLALLRKVLPYLPAESFHGPEEATTPQEALKLWKKVKLGKHPLTREGLVVHPPMGKPSKIKLLEEQDVHLREMFPGKGKYLGKGVGGFRYSLDPEGPILGEVGTGLSDELRRLMHEDPESFIGRIARVRSQGSYPSGALRAPALLGLHEDEPLAKASSHRPKVCKLLSLLKRGEAMEAHAQATDSTCGPAALKVVLGPEVTEEQLSLEAWTSPEHGTRPHKMLQVARLHGRDAALERQMTIERLRENCRLGRAVICAVQSLHEPAEGYDHGHYVVVTRCADGQVTLIDPSDGKVKELSEEEFLSRWHDRDADGVVWIRMGLAVGEKKGMDAATGGQPATQSAVPPPQEVTEAARPLQEAPADPAFLKRCSEPPDPREFEVPEPVSEPVTGFT